MALDFLDDVVLNNPLVMGMGTKNVLRNVPIVNSMLGLTTPEEMAERRLQAGLAQAGTDLKNYYGQAQDLYTPYAGLAKSLPGIQERLTGGEFRSDPFNIEDFNFDFELDPGYQFAQEQGNQAIENMMSARGLSNSGREKKELARFNQGLASQQYGSARDRAFREHSTRQGQRMGLAQFNQNSLQQQFSNELGLANMGLGAVDNQANMLTGLGQGLANLAMGKGQAGASRIMGETAASRGMLTEILKMLPKAMAAGGGG